jgi:hypothetical protein
MKIIFGSGRHRYLARVSVFLITAALIAGMAGCDGGDYTRPSKDLEIQTWYDLDKVRDNLEGSHILMNDLDSTSPGYQQLASPTANGGQGWEPIGYWDTEFSGTFDGQGYEIRDLFIDRPEKDDVGLFGRTGHGGRIKDIGVVSANVTGGIFVGCLVGDNLGQVNNSYSTGTVTGPEVVGGLLGVNDGPVSDAHFIGNVNGDGVVGGLVGGNGGPVSDSYCMGSVTGRQVVGGLVGSNFYSTVSNSNFTGSVTGEEIVGGLAGENEDGTVGNSSSTGSVNGIDGVGGLMGCNYGTINNSYSTSIVYGDEDVGGLVGSNTDTVSNSYSTGSVTGTSRVGGLVGWNRGSVSDSYSIGNVTGDEDVGGLVGLTYHGTVSSSLWDIQTSGRTYSDGGTGQNTTEMKNIATFSGVAWNITAVALNETDPAYIWNIVNNITYPFLSWQAI